jgi:hypothetical protein
MSGSSMRFTNVLFGCAVFRAVADFFLTVVWRSLQITVFGTYQDASTIVRKAFDWKRSRISMLEVESVLQSCIP